MLYNVWIASERITVAGWLADAGFLLLSTTGTARRAEVPPWLDFRPTIIAKAILCQTCAYLVVIVNRVVHFWFDGSFASPTVIKLLGIVRQDRDPKKFQRCWNFHQIKLSTASWKRTGSDVGLNGLGYGRLQAADKKEYHGQLSCWWLCDDQGSYFGVFPFSQLSRVKKPSFMRAGPALYLSFVTIVYLYIYTYVVPIRPFLFEIYGHQLAPFPQCSQQKFTMMVTY